MTRHSPVVAALFLLSCASGPPAPAALDTANEACRHCRMAVSDRRFAAQIVAPGEEPLFFDDLGCLRDYVSGQRTLPEDAVVYVADHRTTEWVEASVAVYTRTPALATPMASGLTAHGDTSSRDQDPLVRGGEAVSAAEVIGPGGGQGQGEK